jgi:hypothetical protein
LLQVVGMRHKETWGLCLLVIADALSTYWLITRGYATEFNPLMGWLIQLSWGAFFGVKFATVGDGGGSGGVVSAAQPAVCAPLAACRRAGVPDALGGRRGGEQLSEVKV